MSDFPSNWQIAQDFDPQDHMMNLKGRDYLNVQNRMVWFIRDQRALIAARLSTQPYRVESDLVELDRVNGWAHFRATVVDVLGNASTAYGSESVKDFADYIEKAATKALGRALIGLGYGTQFAPEMDEGERVVDAPIEHRERRQPPTRPAPQRTPAPAHSDAGRPTAARATQGGTSEWVTKDGYDPVGDLELKKRAHKLGINNMDDFETFLSVVRKTFAVYTRAAIWERVAELESEAAKVRKGA